MAPTKGLLDASRASVFFDGMVTDPQLDQPEGVAIGPDGSVWCGGERGQVLRVDPWHLTRLEVGAEGLALPPGGWR